jgi:hypothetical protein
MICKIKSPVSISKGAFTFCRIGVAILAWLVIILRIKWLMVVIFGILGLSALFKIRKAPMILLYSLTLDKLFPSKKEMVNETAMRFAHILGTILTLIVVLFLYVNEPVGFVLAWIFAILKTISAFGFCPASKLYVCMSSGGCCSFSKKLSKNKK